VFKPRASLSTNGLQLSKASMDGNK